MTRTAPIRSRSTQWLLDHTVPHYSVWVGRTQVAEALYSRSSHHQLWDELFGQPLAVLDGVTVKDALPSVTEAAGRRFRRPAGRREEELIKLMERLRFLCSVYTEGGDPGMQLRVTSVDLVDAFDLAAGAIAGKLNPAEALASFKVNMPGMNDENCRGMLNFAVTCTRAEDASQ